MLRLFLIFISLCGILSAVSDTEWIAFKNEHGKSYGLNEDIHRRKIYEENVMTIKAHNDKYARGESTFLMGINQFADMTESEYVNTMVGPSFTKEYSYVRHKTSVNASLPKSLDWRKYGWVTPVGNQLNCTCSYAFSATGAVEGQHFKKRGPPMVALSQSNLIDCSLWYGNSGCKGGTVTNALDYIQYNNGIDSEAGYPFKPYVQNCQFSFSKIGETIKYYHEVLSGSEEDLQVAVVGIGPISVTIDMSHDSFKLYKGGIYNEPKCSSTSINGAAVVIGYGVDKGKEYWLLKLSFGTKWGIKGYMMMPMYQNNYCGIATHGVYPKV